MSQIAKNILLWVVIIGMSFALFQVINKNQQPVEEITFSEFMGKVEGGQVKEATLQGDNIQGKIEGKLSDGKLFKTYGLIGPEVYQKLKTSGVDIKYKEMKESPLWQILSLWLPMIIFIGLFYFFMRQMQGGGGKAMSFGKSRARLLTEQTKRITFADVAGIDEAKEELEEIVSFLKDPKKFTRLGGRIPKGVLLVGAPGTGKTLLARAIAGEAGVPFFSISGSDFVEMFVGVGASRVRDLFIQGKKNAPCIVFIDEIDAVGRWRGAGLGGGHDEREQTLNQLLVEMDGFESNEGVILIAATNRPDVLDPALLRPGRFDRRVVVPRPDVRGREGILRVHTRGVPLSSDVNLETLAKGTPGFSGADLENLVNEAALIGARENKESVEMPDFERAKDKVMMGSERRSLIISDKEKRITAFHEGGHALVSKLMPGTDPIHKVSIIPRGMALGVTQQLPEEDKLNISKENALNDITFLMGGRVAEELVLKMQTTGAGNDIERATEIARKMVTEWGMSEKLGPLSFGKREEQVFLGREIARHQEYSEATAIEIDNEVRRIVTECYERARNLLGKNQDALHRIAEALLERENLNGEELDILMAGGELPDLPKQPLPVAPTEKQVAKKRPDEGDLGPAKVPKPEPEPA